MVLSGKTLILFGVLAILHGTPSSAFPEETPGKGGGSLWSNFIVISGASNVNRFSFTYSTPSFIKNNPESFVRTGEKVEVDIPVRKFEPSNPRMYDDFLHLLKEVEYPFITISFSLDEISGSRNSLLHTPEKISVTIAGITRDYYVDCSFNYCNNTLLLKGEKTLRLTDFYINPPVKLNGIVKVHNEIDVNFGFILNFTGEPTFSASH